MKKKANKKIARFTRISSVGQQLNGSLKTQRINCERRLEELGLSDDYEIVDFGGVVESSKSRGGIKFKELEKALLSPKTEYEILIVSQIDRLSRNTLDGSDLLTSIRKKGIHVISADREVNTLVNEDDYNKAMNLIRSAEEDNKAKSYRTINGNEHRLMQGYWIANAPFGYSKLKDGTMVQNENAHYITKLFDMYLDGYSQKQILIYFKEKGLKVGNSTLSDWLRQPLYCGRMFHDSYKKKQEYLIGNHEPIISPFIFDLVQESLKPFKKKDFKVNEKTPLKKILKCNCCGSNMTSYESKKLWYYKCNSDDCNNHFSAEMAHTALSGIVCSLQMDMTDEQIDEVLQSVYEEYFSSDLQIKRNREAELSVIQKQKNTYINSCLELGFDFVSKDELKARVKEYDEKIESIQKAISDLNSTSFEEYKEEALANISSLNQAIELGDIDQKQNTLSVLFEDKIMFNKSTQSYEDVCLTPLFKMVS